MKAWVRNLYQDSDKNIRIKAGNFEIGENVSLGRDIDIIVKETFALGDRSVLGDDVHIRGRNVRIGADLYHTSGLRVGGGGCDRPRANLTIGDRCTIHNNYINLAESVHLGNDVGLSPDVHIITHGFWMNVLDGFPVKFAPVVIKNGAIIGQRTMIMPDVAIGDNVVVGAQSVVTKDLLPWAIYAGSPAKFIREVLDPPEEYKMEWLEDILAEYQEIAKYHGLEVEYPFMLEYPYIWFRNCKFDVKTLGVYGEEDKFTDSFRDHLRRYGLRFYTKRPFRSLMTWK